MQKSNQSETASVTPEGTQADSSIWLHRATELKAINAELLQACKDASQAYQQMFDVMPVAFQTYAGILDAAIAKSTQQIR